MPQLRMEHFLLGQMELELELELAHRAGKARWQCTLKRCTPSEPFQCELYDGGIQVHSGQYVFLKVGVPVLRRQVIIGGSHDKLTGLTKREENMLRRSEHHL